MGKKKIDYDSMSKEDVVKKCEEYRRQLGGLNSHQAKLKAENKKLKELCIELFKEYVESHTWIEPDKRFSITIQEIPVIKKFIEVFKQNNI